MITESIRMFEDQGMDTKRAIKRTLHAQKPLIEEVLDLHVYDKLRGDQDSDDEDVLLDEDSEEE